MIEDEFWKIIHTTKSDDQETQVALLTEALEKQEPENIIAFKTIYNTLLDRAYRWDLWGAAYVINGGCSDDGFDYFCDWLISKGRTVYEGALSYPESLADIDLSGDREFEDFRYVAGDVYKSKLGRDLEVSRTGRAEPLGEPFDEDTVEDQYPRLSEATHAADMNDLGLTPQHSPEIERLIALGVPEFSEKNVQDFDAHLQKLVGRKLSFVGAIHNHVSLNWARKDDDDPGDAIEGRCWSITLSDGRTLHAAKYVIDHGNALEGLPKDVLDDVRSNPRFEEPAQSPEEMFENLLTGVTPKPQMDEDVGQATDQALNSGSGKPVISSAKRTGLGSLQLTFEGAPECVSLTLHGCDKNGSGDLHGVCLRSEGQTLCLSRLGVELQLPNRLWGW
ncbi:DUF4240 domain-containing protein [Loktanella agnita]|uniref:DUF4240 domain-containing protein n=1 Tax=Loktanella agnita TaxID=287097 RepID=UPI00398789B7